MNAYFACGRNAIRLGAFLFILAAGRAPGDPEASPSMVDSAVSSAQTWLSQIDSGKYDQSYAEGCLAFHNKVSHEQWTTVLKALRPPLGSVVSRKLAAHAYHPDGFQGLEGECMVITYNTVFTKMPSDVEIVVLKHEDGHWRGAGYNAQPVVEAASDADNPPPAAAQTEVDQHEAH